MFSQIDASSREPVGYPSDGLSAPPAQRTDTFWPAVATSPSGQVYISAYAADVVSPWKSCAAYTLGASFSCVTAGSTIHNARLDYVVTNLNSGATSKVTAFPINTRYQFRGAFIGDYTDLTVGSDEKFHALWTDTNNVQNVSWYYGTHFASTPIHQQDVVTASGTLR